jgi:hypothetical protein
VKRIYHTWDKWECYPAGFYENGSPDKSLSDDDCLEMYRAFLANIPRFAAALGRVVSEWRNSCEHYLSNERMNRIAWLGQAAACIDMGLPSAYRAGYNLLTDEQKSAADDAALTALNFWLFTRGERILTMDEAQSKTEANLY